MLRIIDRALCRQPLRADLLLLLLLAAALLANPYGAAVYGYALTLGSFPGRELIGEWQPLWRLPFMAFPVEFMTTAAVLGGGLLLLWRRAYYQGGAALLTGLLPGGIL